MNWLKRISNHLHNALRKVTSRCWLAYSLLSIVFASGGQAQPLQGGPSPLQSFSSTNFVGTVTNAPAVQDEFVYWRTNVTQRHSEALLHNLPTNLPPEVLHRIQSLSTQTVSQVTCCTNLAFKGFLPESLSYLVWTNFIAHTNGRTTRIWSERIRPPGGPKTPPRVKWDTNCLMWGMKGETALSPSWESEGSPGQVPITALTRRHGYTRGHDMGPEGFRTSLAGMKVWFLTTNNTLVQATIAREVVRAKGIIGGDYTIVLFKEELPPDVETMRVVSRNELLDRYPIIPDAPWLLFMTEQSGQVSAEVPGFTVPTYKGGDSGSPNMLPLPGELVFWNGRSTSWPSPAMQADMDELCRLEHLEPNKYQMQWVSLSQFPTYEEFWRRAFKRKGG